jgi:hypothetical protein
VCLAHLEIQMLIAAGNRSAALQALWCFKYGPKEQIIVNFQEIYIREYVLEQPLFLFKMKNFKYI